MKNARKRQRAANEKDFPKKKRKVGKEKRAPDNATVVSFKAQKVFVPAQLDRDKTLPSTYRKQSLQVCYSVRHSAVCIIMVHYRTC